MTIRRWLPNIAPTIILLVGMVFSLIILFSALMIEMSVPSLGIHFAIVDDAVVIERVYSGSHALKLQEGKQVIAVRSDTGTEITINPETLIEEPNSLQSYAKLNEFFLQQQLIRNVLDQQSVQLVLAENQMVSIQPLTGRPIATIPATFWMTSIFGWVVFIVGIAVWSFRRGEIHARLLAVGGFGMFLAAVAAAIYASRELAMSQDVLSALIACNDLGVMLFSYSLVLLIWYYPVRTASFPLASVIYALVFIAWFLQLMQWNDAVHSFYKYIIAWGLIIVFGIMQWLQTRHSPLDRAALKWFVLTITIMATLIATTWYLPILYGGQPLGSIATSFGLVFLLYAGLALGVIRYKLFELERWWIDIWIWLIGGIMVVSVDVLFFVMLEVAFIPSLAVAVLLIGWIYFPIRQKVLSRLRPDTNRKLEQYIPTMITTLFDHERFSSPEEKLKALAQELFRPLGIRLVQRQSDRIEILEEGLAMQIPCIYQHQVFILSSCAGGTRLFSSEDVHLASILRDLISRAVSIKVAQEEGASVERERIMRDLHDDVAARLLTLVHSVPTPQLEDQARSALYALRDTIYSLERKDRIDFDEALASIREYVHEALTGYSLELQWHENVRRAGISITSRQQINMQRVIQEAIANALKHASPSFLKIGLHLEPNLCQFTICHDGVSESPDQWVAGQGLHNIQTRADELNGSAEWETPEEGTCCLQLAFPVLGGDHE